MYWPPAVGAIDAASAIDIVHMNMPKHTIRVNHIVPAVPPSDSPKMPVTRLYSQVNPRITTYPPMVCGDSGQLVLMPTGIEGEERFIGWRDLYQCRMKQFSQMMRGCGTEMAA